MDVHWMIFAEGAEVVNNKLYLMDAGWDTIFVNGPLPNLHRVAFAATFRLGWDEAKFPHNVSLEIRSPSGERVVFVEGRIEVGHSSVTPPVEPVAYARMAISTVVELKEIGDFRLIANIEGEEASALPLRVAPGPFFVETSR